MKNSGLLFILLILFVGVGTLQAQSGRAKKLYENARQDIRADDYQGALENLDKALEKEPEYIEALLFKADILQRLGKPEETLDLYKKALESGAPYYVNLFYGQALFSTGNYQEAIVALERYNASPQTSPKYVAQANEMILNSQFALKAMSKPKDYSPENLGPKVNSRDMEYFPSISADGLTLVFTHRNPEGQRSDEDFWVTTRDSVTGPWKKAEPLRGKLNTTLNEGAQSITSNGNVIFFAACERREGLGSCDIYASYYEGNGSYSEPVNLGPKINSALWESQPSISSDGRTLYFVRGGSSTARNIEIMYSTLTERGWTEAKKIPGKVNTNGQEVSPFIHFDNRSLYFSSNGHPGMGDLDFFVSRRQADDTWGEPQNLGYPINTAGQEFSLIVAPDGKTGFFSSDNIENGFGRLDLFSFELPEESRAEEIAYIRGKVTNKKTGEPISAEIEFSDLDKNEVVLTEKSSKNGKYFSVLPSNSDYGLSIQKKGFLFYSKNFSLATQSVERAFELNVELIPIEVGERVKLENIFFGFDSYKLQERSFSELGTIEHFLKENPGVTITIEGHTDNEGTSAYNKNLSQSRAKSVYDYLVEKGISKERLSYNGFGDSQPIATNDTEEGRALNRRTEVKITGVE